MTVATDIREIRNDLASFSFRHPIAPGDAQTHAHRHGLAVRQNPSAARLFFPAIGSSAKKRHAGSS